VQKLLIVFFKTPRIGLAVQLFFVLAAMSCLIAWAAPVMGNSDNVIQFPPDYYVGNLYLLDDDWTPLVAHSHGQLIGRAQGRLKVPAGKKLMLILNENFNAHPDSLKNIDEQAFATIEGGATELTDQTLPGILHLKGLTRLVLDNTEITDASLAKLTLLPNLLCLDCRCTNIKGTKAAKLSALNRLKMLNISNNQLVPEAFAELGKLKQLTYLNVCRSNLTDDSFKQLTKLQGLTQLEISDNKALTDRGLLCFKSFPGLKHVDIRHLAVTVPGILALKGAHIGSITVSAVDLTPKDRQRLKSILAPIDVNLSHPESSIPEDMFKQLK
jgi:hypothetical protein